MHSGRLAAVALLLAAALATQGCAMLRHRAEERPPYRKVTPPIAYEMIRDTPGILVLDLRPATAFHGDTGHIYRAFNIPEDRLPYRLLELSSFREETFLVYCDTQTCAENGMAILISSGFESAVLIDGGIDSWIAKGFRTVLPAELAGKRSQAEVLAPDAPDTPPVRSAAQPPALQQSTGATRPAICPEPHVQVQKPPR
ncbi:MAG TPA: rhodanese-like domain-containing protein [Thermoanaerobaculia bacterium]|nr:rhodanese-like domain-containing protein [Thermoanaerobaculia bacterium]